MLGRLQSWLQGHPNKNRPWLLVWAGNLISDARYRVWRLRGGHYPWDELLPNTTASQGFYFSCSTATTDASGVLQEEPVSPSVEARPEPRKEQRDE